MKNSIGSRVKALRVDSGMTLVELGEKTGLSSSYLSQIEHDKVLPSLSTLMKLAEALNTNTRSFFDTSEEDILIRRAQQELQANSLDHGVESYSLSPESSSNILQVSRIVIQPNVDPYLCEPFEGEEVCYVLSGELTVVVGNETYQLQEGDSIHYDALLLDHMANLSDRPCVVIRGRAGY